MWPYPGESCFINLSTGNSSYTRPTALAADTADGCHGDVVCSMTLRNPASCYNDRLLQTRSVTSRDENDVSDDGEYAVDR